MSRRAIPWVNLIRELAEISHFLYLTKRQWAGSLRIRMRKRGKYGLTNTIYTNKIGSFLPFIILGSSALLLSCSPGFQAHAAAGSRQTPKLLKLRWRRLLGLGGLVTPGAPGIQVSACQVLGKLSTRKMKKGLEWITFDDIMMSLVVKTVYLVISQPIWWQWFVTTSPFTSQIIVK